MMLIMGGLIALGIVAFLLAFLLIRSENRPKTVNAEPATYVSQKLPELLEPPTEQDAAKPVLPAEEEARVLAAQIQSLQLQLRDIEEHLADMDAAVKRLEQDGSTLVGIPAIRRRDLIS